MCGSRVLALLVLLVVSARSFSWDIVAGEKTQLEFYNNDGTLTHTEVIPEAYYIRSVTYDPVQYRVLFADYHGSTTFITSFDVSTKTVQRLVTTTTDYYEVRVVYDPVTQALYWKEYYNIYSFSLNPASSNQANGNLIITLVHWSNDLAVDSCGGYIYWITNDEIERARLNGSEREVLIAGTVTWRLSMAIDQQTQKMYWTEKTQVGDAWSLESANLNGRNRRTVYIVGYVDYALSLAVSKDFIYWQNYNEQGIRQLPKYPIQDVATKLKSTSSLDCGGCHRVTTNYTIKQQIQGIDSCEALQDLMSNESKSECTTSICQNYCIQGECSVSAEGQPTCSCKLGYSGERCEIKACHKHCLNGGVCSLNGEGKPTCQCTAGYDGERCEVSICKHYCLQGNCSVGAEFQPKCSSDAGNSGKETVSACHQFCLNHGACSLNEAREPVCQCTADYEGERCEVPVNKDLCCPTVTKVTVTLSQGVQSTCASTVV